MTETRYPAPTSDDLNWLLRALTLQPVAAVPSPALPETWAEGIYVDARGIPQARIDLDLAAAALLTGAVLGMPAGLARDQVAHLGAPLVPGDVVAEVLNVAARLFTHVDTGRVVLAAAGPAGLLARSHAECSLSLRPAEGFVVSLPRYPDGLLAVTHL